MRAGSERPPRGHTWKEIRQSVAPRAITPYAKRRVRIAWFKTVAWTFAAFLVASGIGVGVYYFHVKRDTIPPVVHSSPISKVVVNTDGVLSDDWVLSRLHLPPDVGLMDVNLDDLGRRLEKEGQIKAVTASRHFPSTLVLNIRERMPVLRVCVARKIGKPETLLVARDGTVYRGFGYNRSLVDHLPYLAGLRLERTANGFKQVAGIDEVADLLLTVQQDAPYLYSRFQIISVKNLPRLTVTMPEVSKVIFGNGDFKRQLARLDYILDYYRAQPRGLVRRIDLSLNNQVAVELDPRIRVATSSSRTKKLRVNASDL